MWLRVSSTDATYRQDACAVTEYGGELYDGNAHWSDRNIHGGQGFQTALMDGCDCGGVSDAATCGTGFLPCRCPVAHGSCLHGYRGLDSDDGAQSILPMDHHRCVASDMVHVCAVESMVHAPGSMLSVSKPGTLLDDAVYGSAHAFHLRKSLCTDD